MTPTVLIGSAPLRHAPGRFREMLHHAGFETLDPPGETLTNATLFELLPRCEAVIAGGEPISADLIAGCPKLRVIARTGVGFDAVDLDAATRRKIAVTITPGTNHESVAEHAFALLLGVARRIVADDRAVRAGRWDRLILTPLRGKTLGLVGLGRIGRAMVPRARAFGMTVLAYDPIADPDFDHRAGIVRKSLDDLLAEADVLSLHLPLTPATRDLIDDRRLALMKPSAILINTARGGLVDEAALHRALTEGRLAGAGLDVFQNEPPEPGNALLQLENVVATPHVAGIDRTAMDEMAEMAAQCVIDLSRGAWPEGKVVNDSLRATWRW